MPHIRNESNASGMNHGFMESRASRARSTMSSSAKSELCIASFRVATCTSSAAGTAVIEVAGIGMKQITNKFRSLCIHISI